MCDLKVKIAGAPKEPGCYLFKDKLGHIIYVGKAKNIRNRVRQYFCPGSCRDNTKLQKLLHSIDDVEFQITKSELDALILEYFLIKKHKPWFNRQLKENIPHPFLRIGCGEQYPSLKVEVDWGETGVYIDGFYREREVREAIELIADVWKVPRCGKTFDIRSRACIRFHLGKCMAPCIHNVTPEDYRKVIDEITSFITGGRISIMTNLKKQMKEYSINEEYEKAAACKSYIEQLDKLRIKTKKLMHIPPDKAVIAFVSPYRSSGLSLFYIADKHVMCRADFPQCLDEDVLGKFLDMICSSCKTSEFHDQLAVCLTEITVKRLFLIVGKMCSRKTLEHKIRRAYEKFS